MFRGLLHVTYLSTYKSEHMDFYTEGMVYLAIGVVAYALYTIRTRDEILQEQTLNEMKLDHFRTSQSMLWCTRNEAERLIDSFYGRWSGLVDEWELSSRTASLYKRVIEVQRIRKDMEKNEPNP